MRKLAFLLWATTLQAQKTEHLALTQKGGKSGVYKDTSGLQVAFHLTPGYETYKGLGWYGVIVR